MSDRQPISPRLASFLVNAAQSLDVLALEIEAHGLNEQARKISNIARVLRERKSS